MRYLFLRERSHLSELAVRLVSHLRRWGLLYVAVATVAGWFHTRYAFGFNVSPSLPQHMFVIEKGVLPQRGDYVAFRWLGGGPYPSGKTFVKRVAGMPGDVVSVNGRDYYVNGTAVGRAKPVGLLGQRLSPGPTGQLPAGRYFVSAPHPDSLDSRYALTGWIGESQIIGVAHAVF